MTGYTDSIGSNAVNIPLSQARAQSVVAALAPLTGGVSYSAGGQRVGRPGGAEHDARRGDNPAGRALNRRVTIAFAATATRPTPPPQTSGHRRRLGPVRVDDVLAPVESGNSDNTYTVSGASLYRDGA